MTETTPDDAAVPAPTTSRWSAVISRLGRWAKWASDHEVLCMLYVVAVMLALAALSAPVGIHSVQFDGHLTKEVDHFVSFGANKPISKEVGYMFALNWGPYSVVVVPFMTLFAIRLWRYMPATLRKAAETGLLRDSEMRRVDVATVEQRWKRVQRQCLGLFVILAVCVTAFVGWDWWEVVAHPLFDADVLKGLKLSDPTMEFDWSIACRYRDGPSSCLANGVFGAVAYLLIAMIATAGAFASCLAATLFVGYLCGGVAPPSERFTYVAVPRDGNDVRGGFEIFGPFFSALFGLAICVVLGCLAMVVQNAYLRSPTSPNIVEFMFHDASKLISMLNDGKISTVIQFDLLPWLAEPAENVRANPQTGIGVMLMALTMLVSVGLSWWMLRQTAREARLTSKSHLAALAKEYGVTKKAFQDQLKNMKFWPVGWMKQNQLLLLLVSLMASVVSYRLILLPVAWLSFQGAQALFQMFTKQRADPKDDDFDDDEK